MTDYPEIPPTYAGEAGDALADERPRCGHTDPPCPRVDNLEEARFWIRVLNRRSVHDLEHVIALEQRLAQLERPRWKRKLRRGR